MTHAPTPQALSGLRVLDLAGPFGNYAGKLFADMGADTILVEPPEGACTRHQGPFLADRPGKERSLKFAYQNTSKRSIMLDLSEKAGQQALLELAATADLVFESFPPGQMETWGLSGETLREVRPSLVLARLSPFGQTGPYAAYAAEDIVIMALGGMLYLAGYPDKAPLVAAGEQAIAAGHLFGAYAALLAVYEAEATGCGQDVDVSMQEAVVMGLETAVQFYDLEGTVRQRYAGEQRQAGAGVFACADGHVYLLAGGVAANRFWTNTVDWLLSVGRSEAEAFRDPRWLDIDFLRTQAAKDEFRLVFELYSRTRSKADLYAEAQARRVPLCPVNTPSDVLANAQLAHRGFFLDLSAAVAGETLRMPGAPFRLDRTPWRVTRRPPGLGEHTEEVFAELACPAHGRSGRRAGTMMST